MREEDVQRASAGGKEGAVEPLYLSTKELVIRSGLSTSTIHRLKRHEMIPFFQPGGPGTKLLFPPHAIEVARRLEVTARPGVAPAGNAGENGPVVPSRTYRLPGPQHRWRIAASVATRGNY